MNHDRVDHERVERERCRNFQGRFVQNKQLSINCVVEKFTLFNEGEEENKNIFISIDESEVIVKMSCTLYLSGARPATL